MENEIRSVNIDKNENGKYNSIEVTFGPHFVVRIDNESNDGKLRFVLVATHHGFMADASKVGGELEEIIYKIRELYSKNTVD